MKLYDLSQPLNQESIYWPGYPPFEVKYIKRKPEHGVNAQYIMTSNHMGTHLDAPKHFVTNGMTVDEVPLEWLYNDGVVVDLSEEMGELGIYTPEMIESKVEVKKGDTLILNTGWAKYAEHSPNSNEEKYIHLHPGAHPDMVDWLIEKEIKIWGVDCVSTDHPLNLPVGRFLGNGALEQGKKVRKLAIDKFGADKINELFPDQDYQLTHNKLFPHNCMHVENMGGDLTHPDIQNKRMKIGIFPWKFKDGEAAFCRAIAFLEE